MTDSQDQPGVLEPFPCFRLLVIGKNGVGKTSLINQAFGVDHALGTDDAYGCKIDNFIQGRRKQLEIKDQLHAIWLCCSLPASTSTSGLGVSEQKVLTQYGDQLPVMVFTKFDVFESETRFTIKNDYPNEDQAKLDILVGQKIQRQLQDRYLTPLRNITGNDKFPYAVVSVNTPHGISVQNLVKTTHQLLTRNFGPLTSKSAALWASVAQRVNPDDKVESSIEIALKDALGSLDRETSLDNCLEEVHEKLIDIWNFDDGEEFFSKECWFPRLRSGLRDADSKEIYGITLGQKRDRVANLMIYVTDLIFILRMVFIETRTAEGIRPLDQPLIDAVFSAYTKQRRNTIHKAVDRYLNERTGSVELSSENITQRMRALMRGSDTRFNFVVNIPTLPCREPRESTAPPAASLPQNFVGERTPSSSALGRRGDEREPSSLVSPGKPEDERLSAKSGDGGGDVVVGIMDLKIRRAFPMLKPKYTKIKLFKTHQRFIQMGPESRKWAACLRFRLDVGGAKCERLKMTGTLWNDREDGVFEITALDPPAPTGDHCECTIRHEQTTTGGAEIGTGWDEARQITLTTFDNVYPRHEFAMEFTPLPGKKSIPAQLAFVVQVTYPGERAPFTLELQFSKDEHKETCRTECDGITELKESADFIPWYPRSREAEI